jgi:hypothetical protein
MWLAKEGRASLLSVSHQVTTFHTLYLLEAVLSYILYPSAPFPRYFRHGRRLQKSIDPES